MSGLLWAPQLEGARVGERAWFPELSAFAYLNHAAVSPPSREVQRAVHAIVSDYASRGLGAVGAWRDQRERLRGRLARLIGARPEEIALMPSTTRAVIDAALCMPWKPGDRVLCFRGEFPTNVTPWQRAADTFGLEVVFGDAEDFRNERGLEAVREHLARGVRLIAVSAVEFQTGLRVPLAEIARAAHDAGAEVFVDAIQAVGAVPIDVRDGEIDYLACGSHKWLMGLEGAGFLFIREDRARALVPRVAGWLSHEEPLRFLLEGAGHLRYDRAIRTEPTFLEVGAINGVGFAALEAAVAPIEAIGVDTIFAHIQRYHDALEPALVERGFTSRRPIPIEQRSGSLSVVPPDAIELSTLFAKLTQRGVAVSMPDGHLRFAPHWPNALDEVPRVIEAIDAALAG
ncbi:MAG: aminotransferase class V-fold PLP-dependent enzyme [Sandaracinaceae bacterium]